MRIRNMLPTTAKAEVTYKPVNTGAAPPAPLTWKQKWLPCSSFSRRMHILVILVGVVLVWTFVYYKLLHHHFELPEPLRELRKMFGDGVVKKRRGREEETENIVTVSAKNCLPQFHKQRSHAVLHFAVVACDERYEDALTSMKSIVLVTNSNVYFHIFTDKKHIKEETFDKELKTWPAWTQHWMMFTMHPISYPVNEEFKFWFTQFKPCNTQRLFLASILVDTDALIYLDTHILFLQPPEKLWAIFKAFNDSQIAALSFQCTRTENCHYNAGLPYPYFKPHGLNSGVMLMNLTRMRKASWENKLVGIYLKYRKVLSYGDQDILNAYFQMYRHTLHRLPCLWNYRRSHCVTGNTCEGADTKGVSALHRSGQERSGVFYRLNEAYSEYRFEEDFQKVVVNATRDRLEADSSDYPKSCAGMVPAIFKHIRCIK